MWEEHPSTLSWGRGAFRRTAKGQTRSSSLGPHVRFRRVQTLVREGSPLVKLRNSTATPPRAPAAPPRSPGSST